MTTEIAILNKAAVALASDSAVTITAPDVQKIFANANKLFELAKGLPIGIMVYNSAEVAGIPWETLIKAYRASGVQRRGTLAEYAEDFLTYVQAAVTAGLHSEDLDFSLVLHAQNIARAILGELEGPIRSISGKVPRRKQVAQIVDSVAESLGTADPPDWSQGIDEAQVWKDLGPDVASAIPDKFCGASLTDSVRRKIARASLRLLLRGEQPPPGPWSGIVISGFGDSELSPSLYDVKIGGIARDRLIRLAPSLRAISPKDPVIIQPYAQTSEAMMFLQGVDPEISAGISEFWSDWTSRIPNDFSAIVESVTTCTDEQLDEIKIRCGTYIQQSWSGFGEYMNNEFHRPRMEPIESSARFLSKGEIADLAENLVELTSLRNRVSLDRQETVGGATDVAVISKGDGFVWVKRKHYFDLDRNPTWGLRQALADVVLTHWQSRRGTDGDEQLGV